MRRTAAPTRARARHRHDTISPGSHSHDHSCHGRFCGHRSRAGSCDDQDGLLFCPSPGFHGVGCVHVCRMPAPADTCTPTHPRHRARGRACGRACACTCTCACTCNVHWIRCCSRIQLAKKSVRARALRSRSRSGNTRVHCTSFTSHAHCTHTHTRVLCFATPGLLLSAMGVFLYAYINMESSDAERPFMYTGLAIGVLLCSTHCGECKR